MKNNNSRFMQQAILSLTMVFLLTIIGCDSRTDEQKVNDHLSAAMELQSASDLKGAVIELKNALRLMPKNREIRRRLGEIYLVQGDAASATKELIRARELGAIDPRMSYFIAKSLVMQGKFTDALQELGEDVDLVSADGRDLMIIRGEALLGLGELDRAQAAFKAALEVDPGRADAITGLVKIAVTNGDLEGAERLLLEGLKASPQDVSLLILHGESLLRQQRIEEAQQSFAAALELRPDDLAGRIGAIRCAVALDNIGSADKMLKGLPEPMSQIPEIQLLKAFVAFKQAQYKSSLTDAEQVLSEPLSVNRAQRRTARLIAGYSAFILRLDETAYNHLSLVLTEVPNNLIARKLVAALQLRRGDSQQALDTLVDDSVLAGGTIDPQLLDDVTYLTLTSTAALSAGDWRVSIPYLEQFVKLLPEDASALARLGAAKFNAGDTEGGVEALEQALAMDPSLQDAQLQLGISYIKAKQMEKALALAHSMQEAYPGTATGYTLEGFTRYTQGDEYSAVMALRQAYKVEPDNMGVALNLAQMERALGNLDEAAVVLERQLAQDPENLILLLRLAEVESVRGNSANTESLLLRAVTAHEKALGPRLGLAELYLRADRPAEAIKVALPALSKNPQHEKLLELIGRSEFKVGAYEDAAKHLQALTRVRPQMIEPRFYTALALERTGEYQAAIAALEALLKMQPQHAGAQVAKTRLLIKTGDSQQAEEMLESLRQNESLQAAVAELEASLKLRQRRPADALGVIQQAYDAAPSESAAIKLARTQWVMGKKQEAVGSLLDWLEREPESSQARIEVGSFLLSLEQFQKATEHYRVAASQQPNNAPLLNNYAWALWKTGESGQALVHAQQAVKLSPDNPNYQNTLGVILLDSGDSVKGEVFLSRAAAASPDNLEFQFNLAEALVKNNKDAQAKIILRKLAHKKNFQQQQAAKELLSRYSGS
ncbi:PEP-CTERM system TPR-repeat protein PrsT [Aestuariicella hydrocarbonica]|uniref:PEP-CTERM system TPR-repeat protein PrsT n=1 Tax=Pseudomaricurvus hydrocarbonicus TaxID=1470433 RepID=A0A9E5JU37_9GAMM|nr:XrtA/PEP-CTERM system TPR-repeat protein PrsT [Aestuariicella hydrocarbonica]NHO64915.1 PEP-CTERM system TPR-repeat protein PrsT [Aestuariicella hydrocarbonica]